MHEALIVYSEFRAGKYLHGVLTLPIESYMKRLGARVLSSKFNGAGIEPTGYLAKDLAAIVRAARSQGFERIIIEASGSQLQGNWNELQVQLRVICHVEASHEPGWLYVYFPDNVWLEATYWHCIGRTSLHPKHMTSSELDVLKKLFEFKEFDEEQKASIEKATSE